MTSLKFLMSAVLNRRLELYFAGDYNLKARASLMRKAQAVRATPRRPEGDQACRLTACACSPWPDMLWGSTPVGGASMHSAPEDLLGDASDSLEGMVVHLRST